MKREINKNGNEVTLTVTLTKKEMQTDENVAFGYRSARQYLIDKGYNIVRMLSESAAANRGGTASRTGKFVFEFKEKVTNTRKTSQKNTTTIKASTTTVKTNTNTTPTTKKLSKGKSE